MTAVQPAHVRAALEGLDYPADKDRIVEYAEARETDQPTLRLLRALPVAIYDNIGQVMAGAPFDQGAVEEGQTVEDRMNERRAHTHSGLAEHQKEHPRSPIEDELGYNRGS